MRPCRMPRMRAAIRGVRPNGDEADATINNLSHEHNEAITDPLQNAWFDPIYFEVADKCVGYYQPILGITQYFAGLYNQVINGHFYLVQAEWSNAANGGAGGCVLPPPNPTP